MPLTLPPYIAVCKCCEQGLLRVALCRNCGQVVAICDECEAVWRDPRCLSSASPPAPDAQHPRCPHCGFEDVTWSFPTVEDIETLGLQDVITGYSR